MLRSALSLICLFGARVLVCDVHALRDSEELVVQYGLVSAVPAWTPSAFRHRLGGCNSPCSFNTTDGYVYDLTAFSAAAYSPALQYYDSGHSYLYSINVCQPAACGVPVCQLTLTYYELGTCERTYTENPFGYTNEGLRVSFASSAAPCGQTYRKAVVDILCDAWYDSPQIVSVEENPMCYYHFTIRSKKACLPAKPSTSPSKVAASAKTWTAPDLTWAWLGPLLGIIGLVVLTLVLVCCWRLCQRMRTAHHASGDVQMESIHSGLSDTRAPDSARAGVGTHPAARIPSSPGHRSTARLVPSPLQTQTRVPARTPLPQAQTQAIVVPEDDDPPPSYEVATAGMRPVDLVAPALPATMSGPLTAPLSSGVPPDAKADNESSSALDSTESL